MPLTDDQRDQRVNDAMAALNAPNAAPDITKQVLQQIKDSPDLDEEEKKKICGKISDEWARQQVQGVMAEINAPGAAPDIARQVIQRIKDSPDIEDDAKTKLWSNVRIEWIKQQADKALAEINAPGAASDIAKQLLEQIQDSPHIIESDKGKLIDEIRVRWVGQQTPDLLAKADGPDGFVKVCQDIADSPDYRPEDKVQLIGSLLHAKISAAGGNTAQVVSAALNEIHESPNLTAEQKRELQARVVAGGLLLDRESPKIESTMGRQFFAGIKDCESLTPEEKVELCCHVVAQVAHNECLVASSQAQTLMRGNSVGTDFMTAYINEHAADYFNAVKNAGLQAAKQAPLNSPDPAMQEFMAASALMTAIRDNAHLLEGPASRFIQTTCQAVVEIMPAEQSEAAIQKVMANTIALRGLCPKVAAESGIARRKDELPPQERAAHALLFEAGRGVQQYANLRGHGEIMGHKTACYDMVVNDADLGREFSETFKLIADGHRFDTPALEVEGKKSKIASVRDALKGVGSKIKNAVVEKVDQIKAARLQSQCDKRAAHGEQLADRKQIADHIAGLSPEAKDLRIADLQGILDPDKLLKGNREERARQMNIMDQIEMCKMSPQELKSISDNLDARIKRNQEKLKPLEQKKVGNANRVGAHLAPREPAQAQGQRHNTYVV